MKQRRRNRAGRTCRDAVALQDDGGLLEMTKYASTQFDYQFITRERWGDLTAEEAEYQYYSITTRRCMTDRLVFFY